MIEVRKFDTLGRFQNGWLNARHHFSFGEYYDPARMGWGPIRVWNDDEIAPGQGFDPHPHRDMEIITYVRQGAITHRDSIGNEGRTEAGDVQVMSAGSGVVHSEYNLEAEPTRIFQIWIEPTEAGGAPDWSAAEFPKGDRAGSLAVLASGQDADILDGALPIRTDARILGATLPAGESVDYASSSARKVYLVAATGAISVNGKDAEARDGVAITGGEAVTITARADSEIVLVDASAG